MVRLNTNKCSVITANPMMADDHHFGILVHFGQPRGQLTHRDQDCAGQATQVPLPRLAHIEQHRRVAGLNPGGEFDGADLAHQRGPLKYERGGLRRILQGRDAGFEQRHAAKCARRRAGDELGLHHRGLADDGEQASADPQATAKRVRQQRGRTGEDDDIEAGLVGPVAGGVAALQHHIAEAVGAQFLRRRCGEFGAISNACNHVGGPLSAGCLDRDFVVCPWHQWKFHCVTGAGEPGYEDDRVPSYPVRIEKGRVLVEDAHGFLFRDRHTGRRSESKAVCRCRPFPAEGRTELL